MSMQTIYNPKGQAREYGEWAANPYKGCGHKCVYCYVPRNPYFGLTRKEFDAGATLKPGFIEAYRKKASSMMRKGVSVNVFFTFTSDMYNPFQNEPTREILKITKEYGHSFTILTKGGSRALRDMDLYTPSDHFASTLTSLSDSVSLKWERGAALPKDRIETLKRFHEHGIFTWMSGEPVLSANDTIEILKQTHGFIDFYKLGRMNYLDVKIDWKDYTHRLLDVVQHLGIRAYFKKDLQPYLPAWYENKPLQPQQEQS